MFVITYIGVSLLFWHTRCENMQEISTNLNDSIIISCDAKEFDHMMICWLSSPKGMNLRSHPPGCVLDNGRVRAFGDKFLCGGEIQRVISEDIGIWTCFFAMHESSKTVIKYSNVVLNDKNAYSLTKYGKLNKEEDAVKLNTTIELTTRKNDRLTTLNVDILNVSKGFPSNVISNQSEPTNSKKKNEPDPKSSNGRNKSHGFIFTHIYSIYIFSLYSHQCIH